MSDTFISSMTFGSYNASAQPTGAFTVRTDQAAITYTLTEDECSRLATLLYEMVAARRQELAASMLNVSVPLLANKTIEAADDDEIHF